MSRFNSKKEGQKPVATLQGGVGFNQNPKIELISLLATGLDSGNFYQSSNQRLARIEKLVTELDPLFVAKAIVYARNVLGQRSVTHFATAKLAPRLSAINWAEDFYSRWNKQTSVGGMVGRLDDMAEVIAAITQFRGDGKAVLPAALKRGFSGVLNSANYYQVAKYKMENRDFSLVDIMRLTHPKPNAALEALMKGEAMQTDTVENRNTDSGKKAAKAVRSGEMTKEDAELTLMQDKTDNFRDLLESDKLGYLALLRNLRNIVKTGNRDLIKLAGQKLENREWIRKSLVFPHQIDLALEVLLDVGGGRYIAEHLNRAYELSVGNLSELGFDEHTAVVVDTSGSMFSTWSGGLTINNNKTGNREPAEKAALMGATFAKGVHADLFQFSSSTAEMRYNPGDSINTIKTMIMRNQGRVGHGTYFNTIFERFLDLKRGYKRIFILTDGQAADNVYGSSAYKNYCAVNGKPYIYYVDLCGYGVQPFKESDRFFPLAGYSAQVYETAKKYEVDPAALLKEVEKIKFK